MADLSDLQAASFNKIVGSDSSGNETTPINSDINGNMFVKDFATSATGSAVPSNASFMGAKNPSNNLVGLITDSSSNLYVNVASTAPPNNITATGTLTGTGQTVNLTLQGTASVNIDVSGSGFVGTLVVIENTPSQSRVLGVFNVNSSPIAPSITANGNYRVVGLATSSTLTVQFSAYTSGSATINIYGSTAPFIMMPYSANAANVLVTSYLNDGSGSAITSTTTNSKQRLDVGTASEGLDGAAAPFWAIATGGKDDSGNLQTFLTDTLGNQAVILKDSSGNGINSYNSQLDTADIINTAISSGSVSVTTTAVAARVGASNLANRKMIMITPTNGTVYMGASNAVTTATGTPIYQGQTVSFSFSANVTPYLIAATTVNVNIFEGS